MDRVLTLQAAITGSKQIITDASVALGAIRPNADEE